jgi:hypothetical protein
VVAEVDPVGVTPTMSWSGDVIVYESGRIDLTGWRRVRSRLYRVSVRKGVADVLADAPDPSVSYSTPEVLPGGRAVLYTLWRPNGERGVYALSLDTRQTTLLVKDGMSPQYVAGHVLYATRDGTVFRRPFDVGSLRFTGDPVTALTGVSLVSRTAQLAVSESGTLLYLPDSLAANGLALISRDGAITPLKLLGAPRQRYLSLPRFSPDGRRIVVPVTPNPSLFDSTALYVYELGDSAFSRIASGLVGVPEWTPDGRRISFAALGARGPGIYATGADGSGAPSLLFPANGAMEHHSWSPDGKWLIIRRGEAGEVSGGRLFDLWRVDVPGTDDSAAAVRAARARPVVATPADERQPAVSPDGRWLAYISNESGVYEVFVRSLGDSGGRWPISAGGGLEPRWSRDGKELFYRSGEMLVSVPVQLKPSFAVKGPRTTLFRLPDPPSVFGPNYDVSPNGRGFVSRWKSDPDIVPVLLNWFSTWK